MSLLSRYLNWSRRGKKSTAKRFKLIYAWANPEIPKYNNAPYVYVFKVTAIGSESESIQSNAIERSRSVRRFVQQYIIGQDSQRTSDLADSQRSSIWAEIIPSRQRPATHRVELGILRKESGIPRSQFFSEYFCFAPLNNKSSDRVAVQIAGFVASQLEDARVFDGAAIERNRAYWMLCIMAGWRLYGR